MNEEFTKYIAHCGGNKKAAGFLGCSVDMVRKMKTGARGIGEKYVQIMYRHKGFRLSFLRLFHLE